MGKTVALEGPSLAFARAAFAQYYASAPPPPPRELLHREFAYAPFGASGMRRHIGVRDAGGLASLCTQEVPRHTYYSSAYYKDPGHPIMVSKGWEGADVIFDLDADHLRDAEGLTYPQQLELVRGKFRLLVEDYLFRDFGLGPEDVTLAFSGGRGYHAHIHKDSYLGLNSAARRELVEYLGGEGADLRAYLYPMEKKELKLPGRRAPSAAAPSSGSTDSPPERTHASAPRSRKRMSAPPVLPPVDAPGWKGRFARSFDQLLAIWQGMSVEAAAQDMVDRAHRHGIDDLTLPLARQTSRALFEEGKAEKARTQRILDVGGKGRETPIAFVQLILAEGALLFQGEADAPVTTDIHRLIRLPGSLHGGTGFRVLRLEVDELPRFSPLRDALLPARATTALVEVVLETSVDYPLGDALVKGAAGERLSLPGPQALFLVLRGEATVPGPS